MNEKNISLVRDIRNAITSAPAFSSTAKAARRILAPVIVAMLPATMLMLSVQTSPAVDAAWSLAPGSEDWNTATNWHPAIVPNDPAVTAIFGISNQKSVSLSAPAEVGGINFLAGDAYTIIASFPLSISGAGITNDSGLLQNFVAESAIRFTNSATAGSFTMFTSNAGGTQFFDTSTAGYGTFVNNGAEISGGASGFTNFYDATTAGNGTFTTNGGTTEGAFGAATQFFHNSSAGQGIFTTNGGAVTGASGGFTEFFGTSTAGGGTFTTASGGQTSFYDNSTANNGVFTANASALMWFTNNSSAGNGTFIAHGSPDSSVTGAVMDFSGNSTAGNGTFIINGGPADGAAGGTMHISSSAGNGTFTINGGTVSGALGGTMHIFSSAGHGIFTINGGAVSGAGGGGMNFTGTSTAGNATLIANGGSGGGEGGRMLFLGDSTGDAARVAVFGNANLDIGPHNAPGVTIGSLDGNGDVFLGARNLTVGNNNLSVTFSGVIQGGGITGGRSGSLSKIGSGTLSLMTSNTYSGGTLISAGIVEVLHDGALGTGRVNVAAGATLRLQSGATNNYIADTTTLTIASDSTIDLNFSGNADRIGTLVVNGVPQPPGLYGSAASGAPNQFPQFTGTGKVLVTLLAASRKTQGDAGTFDIYLPLSECRSGGENNDYEVIITFVSAITFNSAAVTTGTGTVTSVTGSGTPTVSVNLTGVTNAQRITITLFDVIDLNDGTNLYEVPIQMGILIGDTTANGAVNSSDIGQTKAQAGQVANPSNFRNDVTADGAINSSDIGLVNSTVGTFLP